MEVYMKIRVIRIALLLPCLIMAALVLSTITTVYGASGNKVNMGEADSHVQVTPSQKSTSVKSETTRDESSENITPAEENQSQRKLQPLDDTAPAGQEAHDQSLPKHMQPKKEQHTVKESQ